LGESLLLKAVANSTGMSVKAIKAESAKIGDLGDVAQVINLQISVFRPLGRNKKPCLTQNH
jgi:hypothetical protein